MGVNLNIISTLSRKKSSPFPTAEVKLFIENLTIPLSDAQVIRLNNLVVGLKSRLGISKLYDFFDVFNVQLNQFEESSLKNLVKNTNHCTLHGIMPPSFDSFEGFTTNKSQKAYINTNYNPYQDGVNYKKDDAAIGIYFKKQSPIDSVLNQNFGCDTSNSDSIWFAPTKSPGPYVSLNSASTSFLDKAPTSAIGLHILNRPDNNTIEWHIGKELYHTKAIASSNIPDAPIYIGSNCQSNGISERWIDSQVEIFFASKSMTNEQRDIINEEIEKYRESLFFINKNGVMSIRVDNPYIVIQENALTDLMNVFNANNVKILMSHNLWIYVITNGYDYLVNELKEIEQIHELADHTPCHNPDYFRIPLGYENEYTSMPGINKIVQFYDYQIAILDLEESELSSAYDISGVFTLNSTNNRIEGDFSSRLSDPTFIYIDNVNGQKLGWKRVMRIEDTYATVEESYGQDIEFSITENISMRVSRYASDIILTEDATYALLHCGQKWFESLELTKNKCWIHPGATSARVSNANVTSAMNRLEMNIADTYEAPDIILTYNHDKEFPYAKHTWNSANIMIDDMFAEGDDSDARNYIADSIAKNNHTTVASHFAYDVMAGASVAEKITAYIAAWTTFLSFFKDKNIKTITYSELKYNIIDGTDFNIKRNIIPSLNMDILERGKPDGYELGVGVSVINTDGVGSDGSYSLLLNGNGEIFTIEDLGGLEKTTNEFSVYLKGIVGAVVTFQFGSLQTLPFTIEESGWNEFKGDVVIPIETNFITIIATASNNDGNDIFVSGMRLNKK